MPEWHPIDGWMTLIAALAGAACAVVGTPLLLRRMSMMADALSHAVLPGIVIAYLLVGDRGTVPMTLGAVGAALAATLLVQWLTLSARLDRGAAIGSVLTTLFAVGLLLIVRFADRIDLDPGCVLHGSLEAAAFRRVTLLGVSVPPALLVVGSALLLNVIVVTALLKEFRVAIFDPGLADAMAIGSARMQTVLMILVSITVVACFEAVGSILPIALIAAPAAAARLLTGRLVPMLLVSALIACVAAVLGHLGAITLPRLVGAEETVTSGSTAVAALALFVVAWLWTLGRGRLARGRTFARAQDGP